MRYTFGAYELDTDRFELVRAGEPVGMEPQTFEVLAYLVEHPERVVSRQELLDAVWGTAYISDAALATRIKEARRAVGDDGQAQRMIRTVHGRGYRFVGRDKADPQAASQATEHPAQQPGFATTPPALATTASGTSPEFAQPPLFVGRAGELDRLRYALDRAIDGTAGIVMLTGEPGIGKTRTAQELETYARTRGTRALWGRAQEFAGAPPYWPWIQVFRDYRALLTDARWQQLTGPYQAEIQRLLPGDGSSEPLAAPPADESEDAQFRLFEAISALLADVSRDEPLCIVLDDLQWADAATLSMLVHLVRHPRTGRWLIIGTYRDTDTERTSTLHRTLSELSREPSFQRLHLRGLDRDDVERYLQSAAIPHVPRELTDHLYDRTEGNPFFLSEVVKLIADNGLTDLTEGGVALAIPTSVREALGRRVERLSPDAHALLTTAAVIGREFEHRLLTELADNDDDSLVAQLEEALTTHVIEEAEVFGEYRFTHALLQNVLLDELSPPRRARLHGRIAETMERLAGDASPTRAAPLAAHYVASAAMNPTHARPAAHYLRLAAEQARTQLAWDDAAQLYRRCLDLVTAHDDRLGEDEITLWLELALSQLANGRFLRGDAARHALSMWPADDPTGLARALLRIFAIEPAPPMVRYLLGPLDRALTSLGPEPSEEACALLSWKAMAVRGEAGDLAAVRADEMANALGYEGDRYPAALRVRPGRVALDHGQFSQALAEFEALDRLTTDPGLTSACLLHRAYTEWPAGDLARTEGAVRSLLELNREHGTQRSGQNQLAWLAFVEWRRGRLKEAQALLADVPRDLNLPAVDLLRPEMALVSDDLDGALAEMPVEEVSPWLFFRAERLGMRCRIHLARSERHAAHAAFREWRAAFEQIEEADLLEYLFALHAIDDAVCEFADESLLRRIQARLDPLTKLRNWWLGSGPDYLRGAIASQLGEHDPARNHFEMGTRWADEQGVPLVAGRCHQGLAALATGRGDSAAAREHLDTAEHQFTAIGAALYLDGLRPARAEAAPADAGA